MPKNGLILFALFFTVNRWWTLSDPSGMLTIVGRSVAGFALFTILTASVYLLNDVLDADRDRVHHKKRYRPIASGVVPIPLALALSALFAVAGLGLSFVLGMGFGFVSLGYIALMLAYNFRLKHEVILDVMAIAAGFVLRAVAGSVVIDHSVIGGQVLHLTMSPWLYICTALGALFIALAKRRGEMIVAGARSTEQRTALQHYTVPFLDMLIAIVATATLVAYALYTFSGSSSSGANVPANESMMFTIPFVAYGVFRYLYLMYSRAQGEAPEEILITDRPLFLCIVGWLLTAAVVLLVNR